MAEVVTFTDQDREFVRRAIELAESGRGFVSPNPVVGAVLVRHGHVIGEGFHARLGGLHAERAALEDCVERGNEPRGATMYVSMEPCAHEGRQPACTDALLAAGVERVVIAADDPSEKASGRGPGMLRDGGIAVEFIDGAEASAARLQNQPFRKHARTGRPFVTLKSAMTLDGRTATAEGDSRWISGEDSRRLVHRWRAEADAVAVGIGTALADDPLLTARDVDAPRQPLRVVFDRWARLPLDSQLVAGAGDHPVLVVADQDAPGSNVQALSAAGVEVVIFSGDERTRIAAALDELGRRDITSVLLEGGATLAGAFLDAGEVDQLRLFIAPVILGGSGARPLAGGEGVATIAEAHRALAVDWQRLGDDMVASARLREW
jgi:diaminohydroxyphosphoribosylaminopyrimidine deaminase / 5-amino-6-(5-phosphoribosylamino)uracil reductase